MVSFRPKRQGKQNSSSIGSQRHKHWMELLIFHIPFISLKTFLWLVYIFCWEIRLQSLFLKITLYTYILISCKNFMLCGENSEGCFLLIQQAYFLFPSSVVCFVNNNLNTLVQMFCEQNQEKAYYLKLSSGNLSLFNSYIFSYFEQILKILVMKIINFIRGSLVV